MAFDIAASKIFVANLTPDIAARFIASPLKLLIGGLKFIDRPVMHVWWLL